MAEPVSAETPQDPRAKALNSAWPSSPANRKFFQDILELADAADWAAGIVRVRTDEKATVEKLATALASCHRDCHPYSGKPPYETDWSAFARAALEVLVPRG